jgi:membrane-associated phospholipid phosphatase
MSPRTSLYLAAITAALSAVCIVAIDRPLAAVIGAYEPLAFWDKGIDTLEWGLGLPFFRLFAPVVLVGGMVTVLAVRRWRPHAHAWMIVAGTHLICRFLTPHLKDVTGRLRPNEWLKQGGDTFFRDGGISFPSGHVALFASILVPLAIVAPRTRPVLAIVVFVAIARIAVNAHFVGDTLSAVTLVALVAWALAALLRRASRR